MRSRRDKDEPAPTYGPDLAELVATEHRLEHELADARTRADALIADARTRAAALDDDHEVALRVRRAEIDAEVDAQADRRRTAMTMLARELVARLDAIDGDALDALARRVAQRLLDCFVRGEAP